MKGICLKWVKHLNHHQNVPRFGVLQQCRVWALVKWVKLRFNRGQYIDYHEFDQIQCDIAVDDVQGNDEVEEVEVDKPVAFTAAKWVGWHEGLLNYLQQKKGHAGVPLSYVIRVEPNPNPERLESDPILAAVYHAPLDGVNYRKDSCAVYRVIKQLTLNMAAWNVLKKVEEQQDGRLLIMALQDHYDGPQARLTRITQAQRLVRALHYKAEQSQSFAIFSNKLLGAYNVLEKYGQAPTEEMRVTELVMKLRGVTDPFVKSAVSSVFLDPAKCNDFHLSVNTIAEAIACTNTREGLTRGEQRSLMSAEARAEHKKKVKGNEKSAGAGASGASYDDYVPYKVYRTYTPEKRRQLREEREAGGGGSGKKKKRNGKSKQCGINSVSRDDDNSLEADEAATKPATNAAGDGFGHRTKKVRILDKVRSFDRQVMSTKRGAAIDELTYCEGRVEIDNHADTHALGPNCRVLSHANRTCTMSGFCDQLDAIKNVEIVTGAAAWDDPDSGETWILIFHEALWFGDAIKTTLLNPNQARAHGVKVQDDPTSRFPVAIYDPVTQVTIPMEMKGTIAGLVTRTPTDEDLDRSPRIVLSSPQPWDPESVVFREGGAVLSSVVAEVVQPAIQVGSAISHDRHSKYTAEDIARKWRISLQQAQRTLEVTTQYGVRHSIHPLRRRYRTDTAMLGHWRLRCRMYTDTVFNKVWSIGGNRCAQIFCGENYVKAIPLASKALVAHALQEFVHDVGIPNELMMDGAAEQTGPNSDFITACRKYDIRVFRTEPDTPWQNKAERIIGELRRRWRSRMSARNVPSRLWDFGFVYECEIMSRMARGPDFRPGVEILTGDTVNISEWLDFEF
jgi:hypothetical protein